MKLETLGCRLKAIRTGKNLTQAAVAARVGVPQGLYSRWETEGQPVPTRHLPGIAAALEVDPSLLADVHLPAVRGRHRLPSFLIGRRTRPATLPPYPMTATVDDMLNLGETAVDLEYEASRHLPQGELARIVHAFPRDSAWELLAVFHVLALKARLARLTLAQLTCPILVVENERSTRSGAHYARDALVLVAEEVSAVFFPQVWVVSVVQSEWYRLDFLCYVVGRDGTVRWIDLEIDGSQHAYAVEQDRRRSRGTGLPRLGVWTRELLRSDFGRTLLERLAALPAARP